MKVSAVVTVWFAAVLVATTLCVPVSSAVSGTGGDSDDDGGGKLPPDERPASGGPKDGDDDASDVELPDTSVGVAAAAAMPPPDLGGSALTGATAAAIGIPRPGSMLMSQLRNSLMGVNLSWLHDGDDLPTQIPTHDVPLNEVRQLTDPHTWEFRWDSFLRDHWGSMADGTQFALMRLLMHCVPRQVYASMVRTLLETLTGDAATAVTAAQEQATLDRMRLLYNQFAVWMSKEEADSVWKAIEAGVRRRFQQVLGVYSEDMVDEWMSRLLEVQSSAERFYRFLTNQRLSRAEPYSRRRAHTRTAEAAGFVADPPRKRRRTEPMYSHPFDQDEDDGSDKGDEGDRGEGKDAEPDEDGKDSDGSEMAE